MSFASLIGSYTGTGNLGEPNQSTDFGENVSASFEQGVMALPPMRDVLNAQLYNEREDQLGDLSAQFNDEARRLYNANPSDLLESGEQRLLDIEHKKNALIDEYIAKTRVANPELVQGMKTTQEMRDLVVSARQYADQDATSVQARAESNTAKYGGMLTGGMAGAMVDPFNAATLPLGAAAGVGVIRGALIDGAINMGIETFQTPDNMAWAKEAGAQYGFAEAAANIATAGLAGGVLSGAIRGTGKVVFGNGRSVQALSGVASNPVVPAETRVAAQYSANIAHVDDNNPIAVGDGATVVPDDAVAKHRANVQESIDAYTQNRQPVFNNDVIPPIEHIATEIDRVAQDIANLEDGVLPESAGQVQSGDIVDTHPMLPQGLAGAKPRWRDKGVVYESDVDRALFIVSQQKKSAADAGYRKFLNDAGMTNADIAREQAKVRAALKKAEATAVDGVFTLKKTASLAGKQAESPNLGYAAQLKEYKAKSAAGKAKRDEARSADAFGKKTKKEMDASPKPLRGFLEKSGYVKRGSDAHERLKDLGLPDSAFRTNGKISDLSAIPQSELDNYLADFNATTVGDGQYVDRDWLLSAFDNEQRQKPFLTKAQQAQADKMTGFADTADALAARGVDVETATAQEIAKALDEINAPEVMKLKIGEMLKEKKAELDALEHVYQRHVQSSELDVAGKQGEQLAAANQGRMRAGVGQKAADEGLFDVAGRSQDDMFTEVRDPSVPDKNTQPLEYIQDRVNKIIDPITSKMALDEFDRMVNDLPDSLITMPDGTVKNIKELAAMLREDADIVESITTCGLGR